jgi:hypothetical protein
MAVYRRWLMATVTKTDGGTFCKPHELFTAKDKSVKRELAEVLASESFDALVFGSDDGPQTVMAALADLLQSRSLDSLTLACLATALSDDERCKKLFIWGEIDEYVDGLIVGIAATRNCNKDA